MIIKQEINQKICQKKKSLQDCKKLYVAWINGINMNWGMNIWDTVRPWEARFLGNEKTHAAQNRAT